MNHAATDYLAYCCFEGGAGTWARDPDQEEAINRCQRLVRSDWGKLLKPDAIVKINLYDVQGHDRVTMGPDGVWPAPAEGHGRKRTEPCKYLRTVERPVFPKRKRS